MSIEHVGASPRWWPRSAETLSCARWPRSCWPGV